MASPKDYPRTDALHGEQLRVRPDQFIGAPTTAQVPRQPSIAEEVHMTSDRVRHLCGRIGELHERLVGPRPVQSTPGRGDPSIYGTLDAITDTCCSMRAAVGEAVAMIDEIEGRLL